MPCRGWKKEKHEHPWATKRQAKRIACDHAHKPKRKRHVHSLTRQGRDMQRTFTNAGLGLVGVTTTIAVANTVKDLAKS